MLDLWNAKVLLETQIRCMLLYCAHLPFLTDQRLLLGVSGTINCLSYSIDTAYIALLHANAITQSISHHPPSSLTLCGEMGYKELPVLLVCVPRHLIG